MSWDFKVCNKSLDLPKPSKNFSQNNVCSFAVNKFGASNSATL